MQEKQQGLKLPSAWKPDEWICHHHGHHEHRESKGKSTMIKHECDSATLRQSINRITSKRQMENLSLANEEYHHSSRKLKVKRLTDSISQRSLLSQTTHQSPTPALRIPQMSTKSLKRWNEARDAYLGHQYPYVQEHRRKPKSIKQKNKITKNEETTSIFTLESDRFSIPELSLTEQQQRLSRMDNPIPQISHSETDIKRLSVRKQQQKTQIIRDHFDDKCVGTEINEPTIFKIHIEQIDQAVQADLPPPQFNLYHEYDTSMVEGEKKQQITSNQQYAECIDKATETDFILNFEKENEVTPQNIEKDIIDSMSNVDNEKTNKNVSVQPLSISNQIVPLIDPNNDDKQNGSRTTLISSTESKNSTYEQLQRLRIRFNRLSKQRRLLSCLLALYVIIMCALLVVIFILLWAFQGRSLIIYREVTTTTIGITDGVARYGESCDNDNDCKRPFICQKKRSSSSGMCRCPSKYDFIKDQCIGDLNAVCTKDTDCQRYMLCSGMDDGTRRCHCQTLFYYDTERKQCRGDYHAPCESNIDCRANLICNKTSTSSLCSCELHYRYYPLVQKCRGDPGAVCDQATAECVDNAECRDGACECAYQFVPKENKICVDPCPILPTNPTRIRYPGNCRRFIDCQQRSKTECPEMTIFNFRTQLCDYPKNVLDCR